MRGWVVIPTFNGRERLLKALESLHRQTLEPAGITVVDNASNDGTAEAVAAEYPGVEVVRSERNLGFGRAINLGVAGLSGDADAIVLVNNDCVCEPGFLEELLAPLDDPAVGMVAGVLLQGSSPKLVDSAGIELDTTLGSWDHLWNRPVEELAGAADPVGPCGGAAAYRLSAYRELGGFDETIFAYWEDVELALRFREAGWTCRLAPGARALHEHSQTIGAASPTARRLEAFGRGYVLAKYRVGGWSVPRRLQIAILDWPVLLVHLLLRREAGPIRERLRARGLGLSTEPRRAPLELATVGFAKAFGRRVHELRLRFTGGLPAHFTDDVRTAG